MVQLGLQAYRFSISWSRLIPDGDGEVNPEGVKFYSSLIDELLRHNITPWVTIYHFDLPVTLNNRFKGWLGPKREIVAAFSKFARTCFQLFGDRVKRWITLNEPWCVGYVTDFGFPSSKDGKDKDPYTAGHNLLLAHAEVVRLYRAEFQAKQGGQIGIVFNTDWFHPCDPESAKDREAAQRGQDFQLGWFADPVYLGDYPASLRTTCGSRLPRFTEEERRLLKGSSDFFGINSYKTVDVTMLKDAPPVGWEGDRRIEIRNDAGWEEADQGWAMVPWGFRELLLYIQQRYSPPGGIVVCENGCAAEPKDLKALDEKPGALKPRPYRAGAGAPQEDFEKETIDDPVRLRYIKAHVSAVHDAMAKGADVRGYFVWSLFDNFEWFHGYKVRFGIVRVDYTTQKRTIKSSARFYAGVIKDRGLEAPTEEEQFGGTQF